MKFNPNYKDNLDKIKELYLTAFPEMTGKYSFHLCESADGVGQRK